MNTEQQNLLENILLSSIEQSLNINNSAFLPLIKIANEKKLFFNELYESFFIKALNLSFLWQYDYVLENYDIFNISISQVGHIYSQIWQYNTSNNLINSKIEKLNHFFKLGLFFHEDFFNHSQNIKELGDHYKNFKKINKNNINKLIINVTV